MRNPTKVFGAIAVAGLVAAGGSAFTGTGLATTGTAASAQFVGGTVSQAVTGATLSDIKYDYAADGTQTAVNKITLTFSSDTADLRTVTATPTGGAGGATFGCEPIGTVTTHVSVCTPTTGTSYTGLTSLSVAVS
jgi:hypothetical protein